MPHAPRNFTLELIAIWLLVAGFACLTAAAALYGGLRFVNAAPFLEHFGGPLVALVLLSLYMRLRMPEKQRTRMFIDIVTLLMTTASIMIVYQYALTTFPARPASDLLERADHAIGFHWLDYAAFVARLWPLPQALNFGYISWMGAFVLVLALLSYLRRFDELYELAFAFLIVGAAIISVTAFFDTRSYEGVSAFAIPGFHYPVGVVPEYLDRVEGLRSGSNRSLDFAHMFGLVAFPSYHAGTALLLATATRTLPRLWLPFLIYSVLVMVSVVSEGGHNFADLIGGCAFAVAGLAVARALRRVLAREAAQRVGDLQGAGA